MMEKREIKSRNKRHYKIVIKDRTEKPKEKLKCEE